MKTIDEKRASKELNKGFKQAKEIVKDNDKMEKFLQDLERKLKVIPKLGDTLAMIPTLVSLVKNYYKKEYTKIPLGSIIAIISALLYFLSPIDAVPDALFGLGLIDDALVLSVCLKLVGEDVKDYQRWRKKNNKIIED